MIKHARTVLVFTLITLYDAAEIEFLSSIKHSLRRPGRCYLNFALPPGFKINPLNNP